MASVKIISLVSQKGGVGKTTVTMLLADVLHKQGKKVLVVDTDPQRSAQKWESKTNSDFPPYPVYVEAVHGLREAEFAQWLQKRALSNDYFLIDTPPNLESKELRAALFISDLVILPFTAHSTSIDALDEVIPLIEGIQKERGVKIDIRILLNKVNLRRSSEQTIVANAAAISPWPMMKSHLKNLVAYADAANYRTSIYSLPGSLAARQALEDVVKEIKR